MTEFTFATVAKDEYVKIWNANTGDKLHEIKCEFDSLKLVRYSNDGQLLVVVDRASNFLFFNVGANYKLIHKFKLDEHIYDLNGSIMIINFSLYLHMMEAYFYMKLLMVMETMNYLQN